MTHFCRIIGHCASPTSYAASTYIIRQSEPPKWIPASGSAEECSSSLSLFSFGMVTKCWVWEVADFVTGLWIHRKRVSSWLLCGSSRLPLFYLKILFHALENKQESPWPWIEPKCKEIHRLISFGGVDILISPKPSFTWSTAPMTGIYAARKGIRERTPVRGMEDL